MKKKLELILDIIGTFVGITAYVLLAAIILVLAGIIKV